MTTKTNIEAVALSDEQKKQIAAIVHRDCTLIPGANFYTAAELAIQATVAQLNRALLASKPAVPVQDEIADGELIADLIEQNRTLRARLAAPASPSGEDAAEQAAAPMADPLRAAVESMVCMLENGEWAEHASTYRAPGDKLAARLEAAITNLHNELSGDSEQADEAVTELIEKLRDHHKRDIVDFDILLEAATSLEALGADAARYRHLRDCNSGSLVIVEIIGMGEEDQVVLTEDDADKAIDAARAKDSK